MTVLSWMWLALGGMGIAAIIYLHRRRAPYRRRPVSSLMLWHLVRDRLEVDRRRRKLSANVLLLLQALAITVLAIALSGLHPAGQGSPLSIGIIIDQSVSMAIADGGKTRFEEAIQETKAFLSDGNASRYTLWSTSPPYRIIDTTSKHALLDTLDTLAADDDFHPADWTEALNEAGALSLSADSFHLIIVSDGVGDDVPWPSSLLDAAAFGRIHAIPVGRPQPNVGITRVALRMDGTDPRRHEIYVEASNFTDESQAIAVQFSVANNHHDQAVPPRSTFTHSWFIAPGDTAGTLVDHTFADGERMDIRLLTDDAFAWDNAAVVETRDPGPTRVAIVHPDSAEETDFFVGPALAAHPDVRSVRLPASMLEITGPEDYDLFVFLGGSIPPEFTGNVLHFSVSDAAAGGPPIGAVWWEQSHPLFRFVDWDHVTFGPGAHAAVAPGDQVILSGDSGPLITVAKKGDLRLITAGFSLASTDLPYRVAFPVFIDNVLTWAKPDRNTFTTVSPAGLSPGASDLTPRLHHLWNDRGVRLLAPIPREGDKTAADPTASTLKQWAEHAEQSRPRSESAPSSDINHPLLPILWRFGAAIAALIMLVEGSLFTGFSLRGDSR